MKMHHPVVLGLVLWSSAFSMEFRPEGWIENLPATDQSVRQCYIFETVPGVKYRVESSHDLSEWTPEDEIYGLGHEFVVTMREFTPPPPPEPGSEPPDPTVILRKSVSLVIQPSSGTAGGAVISWASLDHGGPVRMLLSQTMTSGWSQVPLFWDDFGDYGFFIFHNNQANTPPDENPPLDPQDAAMFAELENSFPAMNLAIDDSVARSRNAPPPTPSDPESRKFWRVHCDWGIDTDQDGTPDRVEFAMAANGTGGMVAGVHGDAFNADTNNDGISDGKQIDTDGDGTADSEDIAPNDATATYQIGPLPRYALFPIGNAAPPGNLPGPLQINDRGTVLFPNGTWTGGVWTALPGAFEDQGLFTLAAAINDHGEIIGVQSWNRNNQHSSTRDPGNLVYWGGPSANFINPSIGEDFPEFPNFAEGYYWPIFTRFSNTGRILANSQIKTTDANGNTVFPLDGPFLWTLPGPNRQAAKAAASFYGEGVLDSDYYWGSISTNPLLSADGWEIAAPELIKDLHFGNGGELIANFRYDVDTQVYMDGTWHESPTYAKSTDIATDGTAIGRSHDGSDAPILLNGKWTGIERTTPMESEVFGPPSPWHDGTVTLLDTTPGGWVLAQRETFPSYEHSVMLPIRAEGYYTGSGGVSFTEAVGVDDFSIGSKTPGDAVQDRIWIMAPQGGFNKIVKFKAPLNTDTPLALSAPNILFGGQENVTLGGTVNPVAVRASDLVSSGGERLMTLTLGTGNDEVVSVSKPIGLKIMKGRTVNVTVYKVTKLYGTAAELPVDPLVMPTEGEIEDRLNDVFRPQINTTFNVSLVDAPLKARWDDDNDGSFDVLIPTSDIPGEEGAILAEIPPNPVQHDIQVFIVANVAPLSTGIDAYGITDRDNAICWVLGSKFGKNRHQSFLLDTIAHEIGHVFVGEGHPDNRSNVGQGPAPLPGTKHICRLMCSGPNSDGSSRLLVKKEWDVAEDWMETNIKEPE